jgi:hypothetical protein
MPKLFIANTTNQIHQFTYWMPEAARSSMQEVPSGGQVMIAGREMSQKEIDAILKQHEVYGLTSVADASKNPKFWGLVYSIDRPVTLVNLSGLVDRYTQQQVQRGRDARTAAAIATNEAVEQSMQRNQIPGRLENLEMSVEEVSRDQRDESPEVSEGVRVSRVAINTTAPKLTRSGRPSRGRK